jgi:hypothetical protein
MPVHRPHPDAGSVSRLVYIGRDGPLESRRVPRVEETSTDKDVHGPSSHDRGP